MGDTNQTTTKKINLTRTEEQSLTHPTVETLAERQLYLALHNSSYPDANPVLHCKLEDLEKTIKATHTKINNVYPQRYQYLVDNGGHHLTLDLYFKSKSDVQCFVGDSIQTDLRRNMRTLKSDGVISAYYIPTTPNIDSRYPQESGHGCFFFALEFLKGLNNYNAEDFYRILQQNSFEEIDQNFVNWFDLPPDLYWLVQNEQSWENYKAYQASLPQPSLNGVTKESISITEQSSISSGFSALGFDDDDYDFSHSATTSSESTEQPHQKHAYNPEDIEHYDQLRKKRLEGNLALISDDYPFRGQNPIPATVYGYHKRQSRLAKLSENMAEFFGSNYDKVGELYNDVVETIERIIQNNPTPKTIQAFAEILKKKALSQIEMLYLMKQEAQQSASHGHFASFFNKARGRSGFHEHIYQMLEALDLTKPDSVIQTTKALNNLLTEQTQPGKRLTK